MHTIITTSKKIIACVFLGILSINYVHANMCTDADFYLANPNSIPPEVERLQRQRQIMTTRAQGAITMNDVSGASNAMMAIANIDSQIRAEIRRRAIYELQFLRDPRRLSGLWSQNAGVQVHIRPLTNCNWNIVISGRTLHENLSSEEVIARFNR